MFVPRSTEGGVAQLLMIVAIVASAIGLVVVIHHGSPDVAGYPPTRNLFPFAVLAVESGRDFFDLPLILAALQFPVYAGALVVGSMRYRPRNVLLALVALHLVAVALCHVLA